MSHEEFHLSDEQLLLNVEGEPSTQGQKSAREHLDACWSCRARQQELENAIQSFVRVHRQRSNLTMPSGEGPRALLKARLNQLAGTESGGGNQAGPAEQRDGRIPEGHIARTPRRNRRSTTSTISFRCISSMRRRCRITRTRPGWRVTRRSWRTYKSSIRIRLTTRSTAKPRNWLPRSMQ